MSRRIQKSVPFLFFLCFGLLPWVPWDSWADTTPTMIIEEAKFALDQARKAGADKVALDDFIAAKSWLSQAEKEYEAGKSFFSRIGSSAKDREEEIIYLGTMAKLKAMMAEAKAKKSTTSATLKDARRELADYQNTMEVLKKKVADTPHFSRAIDRNSILEPLM